MRQPYSDSIDNTLVKMFHTNRDYIKQEIHRLASFDARETEYRRNGMLDFGAMQMLNLSGEANNVIVGITTSSPIVGA